MNAPTTGERIWGLRGAVQAERNDPEAIVGATRDLITALMERNGLEPASFVSVVFTATADLDTEFPAVAARELGFERVPLLCTREIDVPGAMVRVIRLLAHFYGPAEREPAHVYLGETRKLRADLHAAQ